MNPGWDFNSEQKQMRMGSRRLQVRILSTLFVTHTAINLDKNVNLKTKLRHVKCGAHSKLTIQTEAKNFVVDDRKHHVKRNIGDTYSNFLVDRHEKSKCHV